MKKHYLFLFMAFFGIFNMSLYAQIPKGATCSNPIAISSLPYQTTDNTTNYSDTVDGSLGSNCGTNPSTTDFMAGNDVFYTYTPTQSGLISLKMTSTPNSAIFVFDSCPTTNSPLPCLAGVGNINSVPRLINNLAVTAGTTYYIVISSSIVTQTQTVGYTLLVQQENCTPPIGNAPSTSDLTTTTANLNWSNPTSATSWEVAIQPLGSIVPAGSGTAVTSNPYTATNLAPGTQYQYWVRSKCTDDTFSSWAGPYIFNTLICDDVNKCNYTFKMTDSGANGWNGATMQVRQNGIVVAIIGSTFTSGAGPVNVSVPLCKNVPFDLYWNTAGSQPAQCGVSVLNSFGQTLFTKAPGNGTIGETLYSNNVNCDAPLCNLPLGSLSATAMTKNGATLSWGALVSSITDIYLAPTGSPSPTALTTPTYSGVTSNTLTINNLSTITSYTFYARAVCGSSSSAWSDPFEFGTASCDDTEKCNYVFKMTDYGANGWNGATMQVRQNGIVVATIGSTFTSGPGPVNISVPLCKNVPFDLYWNNAGLKPAECGVSVINSFGQTLFTKTAGTGTTGQILYNNTVNCNAPVCDIPPISLSATSVTTHESTLNWSSPAMTVWDIYVVLSGSPAPDANTKPTYSGVNTNPFTATNLLADYSYDSYVRTSCEPKSQWSTPYTFTTLPTCPRPTDLQATGITKTGATFNWYNGGPADSQWEILLVKAVAPAYGTPTTTSANYVLQPGDKLYSVSAPSPFVVNDLETATIYYSYMRTVCSGSDKSVWAGPVKFNTLICNTADKCSYTFKMTDSGNNGWESGRMQVRQNGIVITTIGSSITNGGPTNVNVSLCAGVPFDLYWSAAGNKPNEIGVMVINPFGDPIYTKSAGEGTAGTVLFSSTGNCTPPSCPKPTPFSLTTDDITSVSAILNWTENGTATKWEVYAAPTGAAAPLNGSPLNSFTPSYIVTAKPFILNGLTPSTSYTYYVRALCSDTDISTWNILSPTTFITKPVNDECSAAISVPVNATKDGIVKASGNTVGATGSSLTTNPPCQGFLDDDVWFSFVATATTHIISLTNIIGGTTNLNHTLYSGNDCGTMTQLYCSDLNVSVALNLIPGNTYKIRVYTNDQSGVSNIQTATFDLYITTPPPVVNDECTTAVTITPISGLVCGLSVSGTLTNASASSQSNSCLGQADDDVWYKFTATSAVHYITLDNVIGTAIDINHAVYTGDSSALTLKYCSTANTLASNAKDFVEGETYYIRVWSNSSIAQNIDFNICIGTAQSPVTASTTIYTAEQLVKNVLINNPCISVSKITSSTGSDFASVNGLGYFSNPKKRPEFPLASGLILSSGNALSVSGPNTTTPLSEGSSSWPGDAQLDSIIATATGQAMASKNASKLEFDFTSMNEFMSFNFLFASEEYGTFQCQVADAFAFLLTDLTTNTTTNLAVVPGTTTPVSVVTIRDTKFNSACSSANPAYFGSYYGADNKGFDPLGAPTNFNGISKLMTASSAIIPNHPYHIKLVVADRQDAAYDTAVFIEGGSFTSGAPECMDHIKLAAYNDTNGNGVKDSGENNFTYGSFIIKKNNTGDATTISSANGSYNLFDNDPANKYDFSFQINPEYAPYYSVTATNFNHINIPAGSGTNTLYFPVSVKQAYKDVSVTVIPVSDPVPGGTFVNKVVYKNSGTIPANGTISFTKPAVTTITEISQSGTVETTNGFTYDFTALAPGETRTFDVTMSIPATVNVGDVLTSVASISANVSKSVFGGVVTSANSQTVVTSQASTTLSESHTEKIPYSTFAADDYLTYTIRFQNTGSANANSVRIEDVLNEKLDLQSLTMINASHNYVMERVGNKIVWKLDYINLVGAPQSDALSRGYLTFKIKMLPGFAAGTVVPNKADIYFDGNDVVATNNLNTEFTADQLSAPSFESQNILLFPNPTNDIVQVRLQNSIEILDSIVIYDLLGKAVQKVNRINADQSQINVGDLAKGVYLVEITTNNQFRSTQKLIIK